MIYLPPAWQYPRRVEKEMAEILERLSTYIDRIERFEDQMADQSIIVSATLDNEILLDGDDDDIQKEPVLWRLYEHNMFYVVSVPPNKDIQKHEHHESVFRFVAHGSLTLRSKNDEYNVQSGMWFVVRANTPYEIVTKEGYVALSGYTSICQTNRGASGSHLVESKPIR